MSEKYFNEKYFDSFKDIDRISSLFDLPADDINKIITAGFDFTFSNLTFNSNIVFGDTKYNLRICWHDSYVVLFIKKENESSYNNNHTKFYARRNVVSSLNNTTKYCHNIDSMFFRFEQWIKGTKFSNASTILKRKIANFGQNVNVEVEYTKGEDIVTKISQQYVYIKKADGSPKTLDYSYLSFDDIVNLDKIVEEQLKEVEKNKNLDFKSFVNKEKNTIQQ